MILHSDATKIYLKKLEKLSKQYNINTNWTKPLQHGLIEYKESHPHCTYDEVIVQFGSPEEILNDHLSDIGNSVVPKRKKIFVLVILICICLSVVSLTSFLIYKAIQINIATNTYVVLDISEDSSN